MPATDSRRSRWGSRYRRNRPGLHQDWPTHEAVADFIASTSSMRSPQTVKRQQELGEALRLAFTEIIEASSSADWQRSATTSSRRTRELEAERDSLACAPLPDVVRRAALDGAPPGSTNPTAHTHDHDAHGRPAPRRPRKSYARKTQASAHASTGSYASNPRERDHLRAVRKDGRPLLDCRRAGRDAPPALWAEVGFAEPGTPLRQIRGAPRSTSDSRWPSRANGVRSCNPRRLTSCCARRPALLPHAYRVRAALAHRVASRTVV